jgi:transposase
VTTVAQLEPTRVIVGVDTHKDAHVAVAKDQLGRHLGQTTVPTNPRGYRALLAWANAHGEVEAWGVEGTGSFGAALARFGVGSAGHRGRSARPQDQAAEGQVRPRRRRGCCPGCAGG